MSVVRLLVLGVVRSHGGAHGYVVQRELESWRVETWTTVRAGSIYHALKQLAKERKLLIVGEEESGEGPSRIIYKLAPEGEAEFLRLVRESLLSFDLETLSAGIAFMHTLSRQEVLQLLRTLQLNATGNARHLQELVPEFIDRSRPPHTADLLDLWSASLVTISTRAEEMISRLEAGQYTMAGEASSPKSR